MMPQRRLGHLEFVDVCFSIDILAWNRIALGLDFVPAELPCQHYAAIRWHKVQEISGFVCIGMYAFPATPLLEKSQTLVIPHSTMVSCKELHCILKIIKTQHAQ